MKARFIIRALVAMQNNNETCHFATVIKREYVMGLNEYCNRDL